MMTRTMIAIAVLTTAVMHPRPVSAHCDTTRGPVVTAARAALEAGDPNLVLQWVRPEDEAVVRAAFDQAMKVRALGPDAKSLADRSFFETVVRIHRAAEGAPYTGLSDAEPEAIIAASDHALQRGSTEDLERKLVDAVRAGLAARFAAARGAMVFQPGDVDGGRKFVAAYVPFTHWVEAVFAVASGDGETEAHEKRAAHPTDHSANRADGGAGAIESVDGRPWLPWMLAASLAFAVLAETAVLVRRRRVTAA